jgi:hypothetical protein
MIPSNGLARFFLLGGVSGVIIANLVWLAVIGRVNTCLPEQERFSYVGYYWAKSRRIALAYRKLYPSGCLLWSFKACLALALLSLATAAYFDK